MLRVHRRTMPLVATYLLAALDSTTGEFTLSAL
jgi:hypothetical protein